MLLTLPDGTRVYVRPIAPEDKPLLVEGLRRLSPEAAFRRFMSPKVSFSAAELRYLGGRAALTDALRTFPRTTEQLLHVDKFLEREPALPVRLPARAGGLAPGMSETFGELDVRNLLQAFGLRDAAIVAEGWGGGRLALYGDAAVIVLRWDTAADAAEWQAAVPRYVAAAFPGAAARTCPPLDACWGDVAAGVFGTTSVLASGPQSADVAAALLQQG